MSAKTPKRKTATAYTYDCGVKADQEVRLKRLLRLKGTTSVHKPGEVWKVLRGLRAKPRPHVLLRRPDGACHIWTGDTFWESFEAL